MTYLALDLGAGSGRAILGTIENKKIKLEEIHRFSNKQIKLGDTVYWDFLALFDNIKQGIFQATRKYGKLQGIAVDTWGVDFGLLDAKSNLVSNPVVYRDARTEGMSNVILEKTTKHNLYNTTGIQLMEINSLFQLFSLVYNNDPSLSISKQLLFIPDLINYFLTGKKFNEYTIASTSQMLNAETKLWEKDLFLELGLPFNLMSEIVHPGALVGRIKSDIQTETGAFDVPVYAVGSHDTASAIAAIPDGGDNWAFLSSGTWSLMGFQEDKAILTEQALQNDFTNEGGVNNKILFMRNSTGLWLLQNMLAEWKKHEGKEYSYEYLLSEAAISQPFVSIVNSDDSMFSNPQSMIDAIKEFCQQSEQKVPETKGELVRCVLESLALKYAFVMRKLKECSDKNITKLYIVGGGSINEMLNQFIADALNLEVITGPIEATALGNILQQAIASGQLGSWGEAHEVIKNSFTFKSYFPQNHEKWLSITNQTTHIFT